MSKNNNVIRTLLTMALLVTVATSQAQAPKDSLMKLVTKEVCVELTSKTFTAKSMDELQMEVGLAFMPVLMRHKDALEKELGADLNNEEGMTKLGQDIGMRLVTECPAFLKIMSSMDVKAMNKSSKVSAPDAEGSITGTLLKVVPGEISHLLVKDAKGKQVKIWWMDYFEGSDDMADNPQKVMNKKVTVEYAEKEVYSAALKQYVKIKVATSISF